MAPVLIDVTRISNGIKWNKFVRRIVVWDNTLIMAQKLAKLAKLAAKTVLMELLAHNALTITLSLQISHVFKNANLLLLWWIQYGIIKLKNVSNNYSAKMELITTIWTTHA